VDAAIGGIRRFVLRLVGRFLPANLRRAADLIATRPAPTPTGTVAVAPDETIANLGKVDHIVVLMLENRSFDHMLGYLTLEGGRGDIDGLTGSESNSYNGTTYPVHHLDRTAWNGELEDPCHGPECIDQQLENENSGFVASYADYLAAYQHAHGSAPGADPGLVMGYYNAEDLPVYDHLAREFCVCDRWFSSVPGATWPNRLYSLAGRAAGDREDVDPPLYNVPTVFRFLDQRRVDWRFYSFDPATLRLVDAEYRLSHHHNFAYVDRRKLTSQERAAGELLDEERSFLDDAAAGTLPSVSWIDPHFKDIRVFGPDSNDDHPPSDVLAGQALVLDVYHALRTSPQWEQSLLIVTYDEHGGIYDHVPPPPAPDDAPEFRRYGVRVPALVVSPYVEGRIGSPARAGVRSHLDPQDDPAALLPRRRPHTRHGRAGHGRPPPRRPAHPRYRPRRRRPARCRRRADRRLAKRLLGTALPGAGRTATGAPADRAAERVCEGHTCPSRSGSTVRSSVNTTPHDRGTT